MRTFTIILLGLLFIGCSSQTPENLSDRVDELISGDKYSQALELLNDADPEETDADLSSLKEKTHLNYGLYLEYRAEDSSMRERMTSALEQYIEVLTINSENQKARAEIKQIMSIYEKMPERSPGEDILEELRAHGFDY